MIQVTFGWPEPEVGQSPRLRSADVVAISDSNSPRRARSWLEAAPNGTMAGAPPRKDGDR